jgi:hypothetical protein
MMSVFTFVLLYGCSIEILRREKNTQIKTNEIQLSYQILDLKPAHLCEKAVRVTIILL